MVSDALVLAELLDGMIVVVRQDYCEQPVLDDTVRKLKYGSQCAGICSNDDRPWRQTVWKKYEYGYGYGYGTDKGFEEDEEEGLETWERR